MLLILLMILMALTASTFCQVFLLTALLLIPTLVETLPERQNMANWLGHTVEVQNGFYVDPQKDSGAVKAYNKLQERRESDAKDNQVIKNILPPGTEQVKVLFKVVYSDASSCWDFQQGFFFSLCWLHVR